MSRIARDSGDLRAKAARLSALADGVDALGYRLDAAIRPARRPDVPELGEIEGIYGNVRKRISLAASNLRIEGRRLQELARRQDYVEALGLAHLKGLVVRAEAGYPDASVDQVTFGRTKLAADLLMEGSKPFVIPLDKLDLATHSGGQIVSSAALAKFGGFSTFLGVAFDLEQAIDPKKRHTAADQAAGSVSLGITGATAMGMNPLAGLTYGVTYEYSSYTNDRFDANDDAGRSNIRDIWMNQHRGGNTRRVVDTGLLGVHAASAALGRQAFGVEEAPQVDEISSDRQVAITARVRMDFPNARVTAYDGYYTILFPADQYMNKPYIIEVDNKTGRVR